MPFSLRQKPLCISKQFHKTISYQVPCYKPGGTFLLKPLQVTKKSDLKRNPSTRRCCGRRASASASLRGSLVIEAAFVMTLLLMACVQLFYLFSLMGFQARFQLFLEQETRERAIYRISHGAGLREAALREMIPLAEGISLEEDGIQVTLERKGDFLETTAVYRAGPLFAPWKTVCTQSVRRRLWNGQASISELGAGELDGWGEAVYITPYGTAKHRTRECAYLSLSVRAVPAASLKSLRNRNGERYTACERCGENKTPAVYITDHGDRYHSSRSCGGISRWITKVPAAEAEDRTFCGKCGR